MSTDPDRPAPDPARPGPADYVDPGYQGPDVGEDGTAEPDMSETVANAKGLRTGWTTGTCASAAARAAVEGLISGAVVAEVSVALPSGERVSFPTCDTSADRPNRVAIEKDAGDDPDCTDRAHVTALVEWLEPHALQPEPVPGADPENPDDVVEQVEIRGGVGVGTVTKPGLGLRVGGPAINPVPERMIRHAIAEVTDRRVRCTISVPGGEDMAKKTSNERLGIVGGISILGTTGVVKPFSTASYRASVVQQIDVAAAQRAEVVVLATGSRSDDWAQQAWPDLETVSFVEVGDFTGIALRHAAGLGIGRIRFVGMAGKIAKLAAGVMMTHFHRSKVDTELLAEVATACDAPQAVIAAATETNTARHFCEVCVAHECSEPLVRLCELAAANCRSHTGDAIEVDVVMIDFDGTSRLAGAST